MKRRLSALAAGMALLGLCACAEHNGPMERAGRNMDKAADKTATAVGKAVEKTGAAIERGGDAIQKKVDQKASGGS